MSFFKKNTFVKFVYRVVNPVFDVRYFFSGVVNYSWFIRDYFKYREMSKNEGVKLMNVFPQLHEKTTETKFDAHYFYLNNWAMRKIVKAAPVEHVDISSHIMFSSMLAAVINVRYVDYRPLPVNLSGFNSERGDILRLPFGDESIMSLSCLHVVEHIGLGRYGDPLDSEGSIKAVKELIRILKPGGKLYFAVPIGISSVEFNAHRIFTVQQIKTYFQGLQLIEQAGVNDDGVYAEHISDSMLQGCNRYACGMYIFKK